MTVAAHQYCYGDVVRVEPANCDSAAGLYCVVGRAGAADLYLSSDLEHPGRDEWTWIMHIQRVTLVERADPALAFLGLWSAFWAEPESARSARKAERAALKSARGAP